MPNLTVYDFYDKLHGISGQAKNPIVYVLITTDYGIRMYSEINMGGEFDKTGYILDGSFLLDGTAYLGLEEEIFPLSKDEVVKSFGNFNRTITPKKKDLLLSYTSKLEQNITVVLNNIDYLLTKRLANEPLLSKNLEVKIGFDDLIYRHHIQIFNGIIEKVNINENSMSVTASERFMDFNSNLFTLGRASVYSDPREGNSRLPIVYGDLTSGNIGIWEAPCIQQWDASNQVYCFANHETLSTANGNSISVYVDGNPVTSGWTFDESNNFESKGTISTISFNTDQENKKVTVKGKGKPTASAGATLMENIIDIVDDFLTVENSMTDDDFDSTFKTMSSAKFDAQSYKAAGVINKDVKYWDILTKMVGTFLGNIYINSERKLLIDIDDGSNVVNGVAAILNERDIDFIGADMSLDNLINHCPVTYNYNYAENEFSSRADNSAYHDALSQNIYGDQEPNTPFQSYWCRDLTSINAIQTIIVDKFKSPLWKIRISDKTGKTFPLDVGDVIAFTIDDIYDKNLTQYINQYGKIISINPKFQQGVCELELLDLQSYMDAGYYLLDGNFELDGSKLLGEIDGSDRDTTRY